MNHNRLPDRRLIRVRRNRKSSLNRYVFISLIALIILAIAVTLAFMLESPPGAEVSSEASIKFNETTTELPTSTTTTTTTASTSVSTTAGSVKSATAVPVGDEYFKDACFIGNSRTQGLMMYSAPETATFYAFRGMTVASFFNTKEKINGQKITVENALKKKKFAKIYIMLGLNELGWQYDHIFIGRYGDLVDSVKSSQPGAKIYVQSIMPVTAAKSESKTDFNNPKILKYNKLIHQMCVQKKLIYLNVREAVEDKKGNLPKDASTDGIHMNKAYCDRWLSYIRTHINVPVAAGPVTTITTRATDAVTATTAISATASSSESTTQTK